MRKFVVGAALIYVGFLLFVGGFIISAESSSILYDTIKGMIPMIMSATFLGSILQVLSGLIGVTGLLLCIASVSKPIPPPITIVQKVPEPALVQMPPRAPVIPAKQGPMCKFCGHALQLNELFCPSCSRAQS